jgi:two-component system phosphate regulon sensor histidine kinase PhoR
MAAAPGRTLEVRDQSPEEWLLADPEALRRLLRNLLDNAFKYTTAEGEVRLSSSASPESIRVVVEDTGCGVAPEHLERLGQRFYRADASRARQSGGTGLGLAICRAIAEQHRGTLVIESQPAHGTRVTLTLPRSSSDD